MVKWRSKFGRNAVKSVKQLSGWRSNSPSARAVTPGRAVWCWAGPPQTCTPARDPIPAGLRVRRTRTVESVRVFGIAFLRARTDCRWIHRHIMAWLSLLIQFQSIDSMELSNHEFTSTSTRQLELRQSRCIPSLSLWSESGLWSIKNSLGISRSPARQRMTRPAPSLLARRACWAAVATLRSKKA